MTAAKNASGDPQSSTDNLPLRAAGAIKWSTLNQFLEQGFSFCVGLVLARLLAPTEFGLVAMVMVFVVISKVLAEGGIRLAVIQKKSLDEADLDTALWLNIILSIAVVATLWFLAPAIAQFYDKPELTWIVRVLSIRLLFKAPGVVQLALLEKKLNFKLLLRSTLPANVISGLFGLGLAFNGYGVWALVLMGVAQDLLISLFLWRVSEWRPKGGFRRNSVKALLPFGLRMASAGLINSIFDNLYTLVIGKFYVPADVGFYQRARSFERLPARNFEKIGGRVLFPLLSLVQGEPERIRAGLCRGCRLIAFCIFPLMMCLFLVAPDLIIVLIGAKWLPAAPLLQLLCFSGSIQSLQILNLQSLSATGRADLFLRLEVIKRGISLGILSLTVWHGLVALVLGQVLSSFITLGVNSYYTGKFFRYGLLSQIRDASLYIFVTALTLFLASLVLDFTDFAPFSRLLVGVVVFWSFYLAICFGLKLPAAKDFLQLFGDIPYLRKT